jgi:hypothetical protein
MNGLPSKEQLKRLREQYPAGTRVELVAMDDPYTSLRRGDKGSIQFFDDTGTAFVKWDNGSGLGLVYGHDQFKKTEEPFRYEDGAHFWRDTAASHGLGEAFGICGRYLKAQLKTQDAGEKQFCREMFAAMYEASVQTADPAKLVYPYSFERSNERAEPSYYHASRIANGECAAIIDMAIQQGCYARDHYNLDMAVMTAVSDYGFERVKAVIAGYIQNHESDRRYSEANREWASSFELPGDGFRHTLNAHPILIDGFAGHFRKLYDEVNALAYALPGRPEAGTDVHGYEITRSIFFNDRRGFAIGFNKDAVSPFVCWQFTTENGARDFYWGNYSDYQVDAQVNYLARIAVHMDGGGIREVPNPLAAAEMSAEQSFDMIDGRINNEKNRLNLTDGQTDEEIRELAPEALAKPSVMEKIREAKAAPKAPRKAKTERKRQGDLEL